MQTTYTNNLQSQSVRVSYWNIQSAKESKDPKDSETLLHNILPVISKYNKSIFSLLMFTYDIQTKAQTGKHFSHFVTGFTPSAGSDLEFQRDKPRINKQASQQKHVWQREKLAVVADCSGLIVVLLLSVKHHGEGERQHQRAFGLQRTQQIKPALSASIARPCWCYLSFP